MKKHVVETLIWLLTDIDDEIEKSLPPKCDNLMRDHLYMSTYKSRCEIVCTRLCIYLGELNEKSASDEA